MIGGAGRPRPGNLAATRPVPRRGYDPTCRAVSPGAAGTPDATCHTLREHPSVNDTADTASTLRPVLPLARYRIRFCEHIPPGGVSIASPRAGYLGSAWRGAFGHALRKAVCVTRLPACDPCVLLRSCPYPFLFESRTPPGAKKLTRYPRTPGPFVLEPADPRFDTLDRDGTLSLGVTLFGAANDHLPYVVHALEQAGRQGLTGRRVALDMLDVQAESRWIGAGDAGDEAGGMSDARDDHRRNRLPASAADERGTVSFHARRTGDAERTGGTEGAGEAGSTGGAGDPGEREDRTPDLEPAGCRANAELRGSVSGRDDWTPIFEPGGSLSPVPARPPAPPPALPRTVRIRLLTPLRVKRHGHFVGPPDFDFRALMGGLLRRLSLLTYFFGETPLETDFAGLLRHAESIPVTRCNLHWREWTRYSSRQNEKLQMGGLVGSFELAGAALDRFWPLLWLGQWTHAGKGCSMGLGRYVLEPLGAEGVVSGSGGEPWPAPSRL